MTTFLSALSDGRYAAAITGSILRLRAERTTLIDHPALVYGGRINGMRSNVMRVMTNGLEGVDLPAAIDEEDALSVDTAYADRYDDVTVAEYAKSYSHSTLAKITGPELSTDRFARDALYAGGSRLVQLAAAAGSTFTNSVGVSGDDATLDLVYDGLAELDADNNEGPFLALLHSWQWNQMTKDVRLSSGGQIQWDPEVAALTKGYGLGYKGRLDGKVDIFVTNRVPTANAGADRAGCIFGVGGIVWADGVPDQEFPPPWQYLLGGSLDPAVRSTPILLDVGRKARERQTEIVMSMLLGVSRGEDERGVRLISSAT